MCAKQWHCLRMCLWFILCGCCCCCWLGHSTSTKHEEIETAEEAGTSLKWFKKCCGNFSFFFHSFLLLINMRTHITKAILRCERCESAECRGRALIQAQPMVYMSLLKNIRISQIMELERDRDDSPRTTRALALTSQPFNQPIHAHTRAHTHTHTRARHSEIIIKVTIVIIMRSDRSPSLYFASSVCFFVSSLYIYSSRLCIFLRLFFFRCSYTIHFVLYIFLRFKVPRFLSPVCFCYPYSFLPLFHNIKHTDIGPWKRHTHRHTHAATHIHSSIRIDTLYVRRGCVATEILVCLFSLVDSFLDVAMYAFFGTYVRLVSTYVHYSIHTTHRANVLLFSSSASSLAAAAAAAATAAVFSWISATCTRASIRQRRQIKMTKRTKIIIIRRRRRRRNEQKREKNLI